MASGQFVDAVVALQWQRFGRRSRLARSELTIHLEQWVLIPAGGAKTGRRGPVGGAGRCLWSGMEGGLVTEVLVREG